MSKKNLKGLWMILITMLITFCASISIFASSDFVIETNDDGKKCLTEYKGNDDKVYVPEGVQIVSGFTGNKKIKEVVLPNSVEEIQHSAFLGCKNLKSINFPKNLKRIWTSALSGCKNLKTIKINKKLKQIDEFAFFGCSGLEKIVVEKGNKKFKIYKGALCSKNMKRLYIYPAKRKTRTKFTIPETVKIIEEGSFYKNKYLKKIVIKGKVKLAGSYEKSESLETIIFKKAYYGFPTLSGCKKLKKVVLAEGTKRIGVYQFKGCENLESINYPSTLKKIDKFAFKGCKKLKQPVLPETVKVAEKAYN